MSIKQLVYASRQVADFDGLGLVSLLYKARESNAALSITGVLLYASGMFVQCLEGPADSVDQVYDSICRDRRHTDIVLLQNIDTSERHFESWMMGCAKVSDFQAMELMRTKWETASQTMDRSDTPSPGFMLMKTIWQTYKDFGDLAIE